jgi:radical SAM superfamily enzyme YgiQ (UPF0313 family)
MPYTLFVLARDLNDTGHTCHILDLASFMKIKRKSIMKGFASRYDIIGFSFFTAGYLEALEMAKLCKKINPKLKIVFGGFHATFEYSNILKNHKFVDYVILGEGEKTLVNLVCSKKLSKIKGLAYRKKGIVKVTKPECVDINSLKMIDALENVKIFKSSLTSYVKVHFIETSRGCPVGCNFCSTKHFYGKVRFRNPKKVIEDMKILMNKGVKYLFLTDPNFSISFDHVKKICYEMKKAKICFKQIFAFLHIDFTSKKMIKIMKEAGFTNVCFGIESLSPNVLKLIGKTKNPAKYRSKAIKLLKYAKKIGIQTSSAYIVPLPEQREEGVFKELTILKKNATVIHLSFLTPYPGTFYWKLYKEKIRLSDLPTYFDQYPHYNLYTVSYKYLKRVYYFAHPLKTRLKFLYI